MRYLFFLFICIVNYSVAGAYTHPTDSLLQLLHGKKSPQEKCKIYRNLADLSFETPVERTYLRLCYLEAGKAKDRSEKLEALRDLAYSHLKANQRDSTKYYMNIISQEGTDSEVISQITYLNICFASKEMEAEEMEAIQKELERKSKEENSVYSKVEYAAFIGSRMLWKNKYKEALPYLQTAMDLAVTIPFKEGFKLQTLIMHLLSFGYTGSNQPQKSVNIIEESIKVRTDYHEKFTKKTRPFYYINAYYVQAYSFLFTNISILPKQKIKEYLQKLTDLCQNSSNPVDKYSYFVSLNSYFLYNKDYAQGLSSCDSLVKYGRIVSPENLSGIYQISSQIHQDMGNYREALQDLRTSHSLSDSTSNAKAREQLNQLQVQYNVDKLNYENSQLEIKNKQIQLIALSIILLTAVLVCTYLYKSLKKERRLKTHLRLLKNKAEESENMKTAFINSVCHEIRTPLNAIVGFTDLIFNEEIDEEMRKEFPAEVQRNTNLLTSLIGSMLEVSNLDVSEEKLPCEPVNITSICHHEIEILKNSLKPEIHLELDIPETDAVIISNERYLGLVIENLLNNANKFTEKGTITLRYSIDTKQKNLLLSITDTGCGIPADKYEKVFERFIKLDSYVQGNGLGLYLCQLIIKRLSGKICIDPTYTKGTRMLITLPMAE